MRTTVTLDDDVAAEVERLRREDGLGVSSAINQLLRSSLARPEAPAPYVHTAHPMGMRVDVADVGAVIDLLDQTDEQ